jgi:hypothetical protein
VAEIIIVSCWILGMVLHIFGRIVERLRQHPESTWLDYLSFFTRRDFVIAKLASLVLLSLWLSGIAGDYLTDKLPINWATALLFGYLSDSLTKHTVIPLAKILEAGNRNGGKV